MGGLFSKVAGTQIGKLADRIHENTLSGWPWGIRLAIAIFWDFFVDTPTRIIAGVLTGFFPGIMAAVRFPLDVILAVFGTALWGTHGLLQGIEIGFALIPGIGWMVDLLPMLTIAGIMARKREQGQEKQQVETTPAVARATAQQERNRVMFTLAAYVIGSGIGFLLWKEDLIGFFSIFLLVGTWGILMRYVPSIARIMAPSIKWGWTAGEAGIVLTALLFCLGSLYWISDPEGFREDAWKALVKEADLMVSGALKADRLKTSFDTSILDTAGGVIRDARSSLANHIIGDKKEPGEKAGTTQKPIVIDRKNQPRYGTTDSSATGPALPRKALAYIAENIIKPAEVQTITGVKADDVPDEVKKVKDRLKLGTVSAKMYMFDFVLERAKKIREDKIAALEKWRVWLGLGFVFLACLAFAQKSEFYGAQGGGTDDGEAPPF